MPQRISLNGADWQFKDFYGEDWRWRDSHRPNTRDIRHWRTGTVPGSVQNDLWALGEIPDPYFERNTLLAEWVPARTWLYKKTFVVGEALRGKRIQLCFEGVDYEAEFFLNGVSLGSHRGMYTPAVFEVSEHLEYGSENLLAVVIEPAPHEQPQVGRTSRVRTHKGRMTYWWDFCPRMVHIGIWDAVYLNVTDAVRIEDVFVRPQLAPDFGRADIAIAVELDSLQQQEIEVAVSLQLDGQSVGESRIQTTAERGETHLQLSIPVEEPRLWWPNGAGEQPLYQADVRVSVSGDVSDQRIIPFGIRRIELVPNETSDPTALPYTMVVNGRKLYAKGWNWVPMDVMYGVERPEKLNRLLHLAQNAHVNLLRVWGGGLIEKEAFYNLCDQLGILVWQEFIQSSSGIDNYPPDTPDFIDMMGREAKQIIPRKRNHPSLAVWCGGNELMSGPEKPLDDTHPLLKALKETVARLDPDRLWLATSPTGRVFSNSLENIERDPQALHDVHGPWEYQGVTGQYELYNRGSSLLHSEFGVEALTNLKTLNRTIAPEHQQPVTLNNILWQHLAAWWVKRPAWDAAVGEITDVPTLVRATQYLQADGLRYALEADRRRKFQNSGTLPWQFNEPYPMAACTSAVDYYGQPKPAYYAVARSYAPVLVSAKFATAAWDGRDTFEAEIWVNNSHANAITDAHLTAQIVGLNGQIYMHWEQQVAFDANVSKRLLALEWGLDGLGGDVFFLDLSMSDNTGTTLSRNRYAFTNTGNLAPLLTLPSTQITVQQTMQGDTWICEIANTGAQTAFGVWLADSRAVGAPGYVYFNDNYFHLFPGEKRTIQVNWEGIAPAESQLTIEGWNIEAITR
jgi:beta-mannosidase